MAEADQNYDYLIKFLALGDSGVGKTSFLYRYTDGTFNSKFISTVGIDFREKRISFALPSVGDQPSKNHRIYLQLWDTAGQERYRSLTTAFYRDSMGFVLMCDVTNEHSVVNLRNWLTQLQTHAYSETPDVVLCANKIDLENHNVNMDQIKEFAEKNGLTMFETSAATGHNVDKAVECLLGKVMARIEATVDKSMIRPGTHGLPDEENSAESNCGC